MPNLPADLAENIRRAANELDRKGLAASSSAISEHYRRRGASRAVIAGKGDAVAYALSRLPAVEGLMLSTDGDVVCATAANLFVLRGERWWTPPVDRCGVAGVCRAWALRELDAA